MLIRLSVKWTEIMIMSKEIWSKCVMIYVFLQMWTFGLKALMDTVLLLLDCLTSAFYVYWLYLGVRIHKSLVFYISYFHNYYKSPILLFFCQESQSLNEPFGSKSTDIFFLVNIIGDFYLFIYLFLPRVCNPEEYKLWILSLHLFLFCTIFTHYYIYYLNYS